VIKFLAVLATKVFCYNYVSSPPPHDSSTVGDPIIKWCRETAVFMVYDNPVPLRRGLITERIKHRPCNRKIAGSIPVSGHSATPFTKEFNLTMLTMVALATTTAVLRATWDKHS